MITMVVVTMVLLLVIVHLKVLMIAVQIICCYMYMIILLLNDLYWRSKSACIISLKLYCSISMTSRPRFWLKTILGYNLWPYQKIENYHSNNYHSNHINTSNMYITMATITIVTIYIYTVKINVTIANWFVAYIGGMLCTSFRVNRSLYYLLLCNSTTH